MSPSDRNPVNIHGRRWGRGPRPILLVCKWVFIIAMAGGLASLAVVILPTDAPATPEGWSRESDVLRRMFLCLIIPGGAGAGLCGVLLAAPIWRPLLPSRWFRLKILLLAAGMPMLHLHMRGQMRLMQAALGGEPADLAGAAAARCGMLPVAVAGLGLLLAVLILGRVKPRLGRTWGEGKA